ncbi:hypothetical protein AAMO2058_000703600 [Amorphochlora amoebiformis]
MRFSAQSLAVAAACIIAGGVLMSNANLGSAVRARAAPKVAVFRRPQAASRGLGRMQPSAQITGLQHVGTTNWMVPQVLPKVYVYDHCPFCVRVRMIYGLKGIRHDLIWLQNDDKQTPMSMHPQQKKVLPIVDDGGRILIESLDIVKAVDEDPRYGSPILRPATGRKDIDEWVKSTKALMAGLSRPRYVMTYLPEFAFQSAKDAFILNHPIDKSKFSKGDPGIFEEYREALMRSDEMISAVNEKIREVEDMIYSPDHVSPGGLSYDDITFFARFRGFTLIKGVQFGPKLVQYLENMSAKTEVPLLNTIAI